MNHKAESYLEKSEVTFLKAIPLAEILQCTGFIIMCFMEVVMDRIGRDDNEVEQVRMIYSL